MKKVLLLSSLALVLTACSNDVSNQGSKSVSESSVLKTTEKATDNTTTKSDSKPEVVETTNQVTEKESEITKQKEFSSKKSASSKIDINAILGGNLSSIYGRYPVASQTVVIDENDTISLDKGEDGDIDLRVLEIQKQGNAAVISTQIKIEGDLPPGAVVDGIIVKYIVVPAGEKSPISVPGENINKDRIIMQGHGIEIMYID